MVDVYYSLYGRLLSERQLTAAFHKVKQAKGREGVDGQTIEDFNADLSSNIYRLVQELRYKSYKPQPVLRLEIPKPDGGVRKLGIPSVRDRVVQQALLDILQPIFEPDFHPSSYGYRPGRSCHHAITKASLFIRTYDRQWVVDMDLSKCFDTLDHNLIIKSLRRRVTDGSILKLVQIFLESGIMTNEGWEASLVGSPQGGVISPLLANVYLDSFDQFMKNRGHRIVRYADDILILTESKRAAENALKQASCYLETDLKLTVNIKKTHIIHSDEGVKFLGVVIFSEKTCIQKDKIRAFKEKVKRITKRNSPVSMAQVIEELNLLTRGFANYYRIANCEYDFRNLMGWIRRRLRAKQLRLWKTTNRLHRRLRQLGYSGPFKKIVMNSWRNSRCPYANMTLRNDYFESVGLFDMSKVQTGISVSIT